MPDLKAGLPWFARLQLLAVQSPWRELVLRSGTVLFVRVVGAGLGFALNVALARVLGADGLGIYHLSLTFILIASVVGRVGMDAAILKFGATGYAEQDWGRLARVHRMCVGTALLCCLLVSACIFLGSDWIALRIYSDAAIAGPLRLMSLSLVPFALLSLYGELLKAGHFQALSSLIQGAALAAVNLLLIFVFAQQLADAKAAAGLYLLATLVVCAAGFLLWRRSLPWSVPAAIKALSWREVFGMALPLFAAALADVVMTFADVLILGIFASSADVGIYTAAARTALLTRFLLLATSAVVAPKFAALHAARDQSGIALLAAQSTLLTTLSTTPLLLIFLLWPGQILSVFGPTFEQGAQALVILTIGQFVNAATGPVGYLLNMTGLHRADGYIAIAGALMTVVLCFVLIPIWGILGAAAANAIATAGCNLLRVYVAHTQLGILMLPLPQSMAARWRN